MAKQKGEMPKRPHQHSYSIPRHLPKSTAKQHGIGKYKKGANLESKSKEGKVVTLHGVKDIFKAEGQLCKPNKGIKKCISKVVRDAIK